MKVILPVGLLLLLTACGDTSILTVRNNTTVPQVPEELKAKCPPEIAKVTPVIPGKYTEEDSVTITTNYRVAYVSCRTAIKEIDDFYKDQKIRAEKLNTSK
jgi:hypothetical protein